MSDYGSPASGPQQLPPIRIVRQGRSALQSRFAVKEIAGNIIPASRISPIARRILGFVPEPNIAAAEFDPRRRAFVKVHQETFGRSGCRRVVPGQYVAADPKGRAVMVAAVEKQKFVYVLNRDAAAALTISSLLEAHKSHNVVFSVAALDMGFDNPVFATIELDYRCACLRLRCCALTD